MKFLSAALITLGLLISLAGCSDSNDQIAELQAELDAANAELAALEAEETGSTSSGGKQKNETNQYLKIIIYIF